MAITITPSRTGMDVGLSDIASILSEQNQVLAQTADAQQKLTNSFSSYLKMLKGDEMDDLQDERRAKQEAKSPTTGSGGMRNLVPTKAGLMDYLMTFLKRLVPVALGIAFGDDLLEYLKPKIENLIGREIGPTLFGALTGAAGGGLLGFLFGGVKGGLYGLVLGALTSPAVRKKIADTINEKLGTELDENDWGTWGTAIVGAFSILWGPKLLTGAIGNWFKSEKGTKFKKQFGAKFAGRLIAGGGILLMGEALADQIGESMGEDAGDFASMAAKGAGYGFMLLGLKGMIFGAVAMLAVEGGKRLIDYLRNKNHEQFDKAMAQADTVLNEYEKTGDVSVLQEGMDKLKAAQVEANRMIQIGKSSGRYEEATGSYDKIAIAMGAARGQDGQIQVEAKQNEAIKGGLSSILDYAYSEALKKAAAGGRDRPDRIDIMQSLVDLEARERAKPFDEQDQAVLAALRGSGLDKSTNILMDRASNARSQESISLMNKYGGGCIGNVIAPVDNSQATQVTNNNSSPMVLPSGGSQDNSDSKMAKMLATSAPI